MTESAPTREDLTRRFRELTASAKDATPEQRREQLAAYREAQRAYLRSRPIPGWLARRGSRRTLAVVAAVPFICGLASAFLSPQSVAGTILMLTGALGLGAGTLMLNRATRQLTNVTGIPDDNLDEREQDERARAHVVAYWALTLGVGVLALVAIADGPFITVRSWEALALGTLFSALLLPAASAAWTWTDPDADVAA